MFESCDTLIDFQSSQHANPELHSWVSGVNVLSISFLKCSSLVIHSLISHRLNMPTHCSTIQFMGQYANPKLHSWVSGVNVLSFSLLNFSSLVVSSCGDAVVI